MCHSTLLEGACQGEDVFAWKGTLTRRGFTLVEVMISCAISLLLLAGLFQVYCSVKETYTKAEALARLQENGRISIYLLGRAVAKAGCPLSRVSKTCDDRIVGYSSNNAPHSLGVNAAANTDVLVIRSAAVQFKQTVYFIGRTKRRDVRGRPINALYERIIPGRREELVQGIAGMRLRFGVDTNGNGKVDAYQACDVISDWSRVHSVQISLFLQAYDALGRPDNKEWVMVGDVRPLIRV